MSETGNFLLSIAKTGEAGAKSIRFETCRDMMLAAALEISKPGTTVTLHHPSSEIVASEADSDEG